MGVQPRPRVLEPTNRLLWPTPPPLAMQVHTRQPRARTVTARARRAWPARRPLAR